MKLTITIDMDNAAFEAAPGEEAARIIRGRLRNIERIDADDINTTWPMMDLNGNRVGEAVLTP